MPTFALNFSRPGGEIIAQYYNFIRFGRDGYRSIQQACVDTAQFLAAEIAAMGPFDLLYDGDGGLPAVAYTLKDPAAPASRSTTSRTASACAAGRSPRIRCRPNRQDTVVQRILVRHGVSRDMAGLLADDIRRAIAHFAAHPVPHTTEHRPGYHH